MLVMAKPALGRGLGHLLNGEGVAGNPTAAPKPPAAPENPEPGRGFKTLVTQPAPMPAAKAKPGTLVPSWFFFTADLMLLAFTVVVLLDSPFPLHFGEMVFCMASTAVAALFGILGVRASARGQDKSRGEIRNGKQHV